MSQCPIARAVVTSDSTNGGVHDRGLERAHNCGLDDRGLIAATERRLLLPDLSEPAIAGSKNQVWTESTIRPLTNKKFTDSDVRRIGKKIVTWEDLLKLPFSFQSTMPRRCKLVERNQARKR